METKIEHWPLLTFKEYENDINPNPTYQRASVWKPGQKQLLIDSILRKIDIPKLYLRETNSNEFMYEIIDGQQRMRTLWEFLASKFPLSEEAEEILIGDKLFEVAGCTYVKLPPKLKLERIHRYTLDVVIVQQATEDEIADLFFRLNNGTPLKPAEVRNAMPGEMTKAIRELARHAFFSKVSFSNHRYAHDQVAAQMMMVELSGGPSDIPDRLLSKMYAAHQKKIPKAAERMTQVLDIMNRLFPSKSRLLNRAQTVNTYLLISFLLSSTKFTKTFYSDFLAWYQQSEAKRLQDNEYKLYMTSALNSRRSIEERFKIVLMDFFTSFPVMATIQLDPKRIFTNDQKIQLYARNKPQRCQSCKRTVDEFDWHADHIVAWIRGGKTTLDNGQVLCVKCNLRKKDRLW